MMLRLATVTMLVAVAPVMATEYFVAPQGADTNDGLSRTTAFLSVQKGVEALQPGDILTIAPGEYLGSVRRDRLGSNTVETLIRAEIPGTAVLRGDIPLPALRPVPGKRFTYEADFPGTGAVVVVNELDTGRILGRVPHAGELDFAPGVFHHDPAAGKLFLATTDFEPAGTHRYSASVIGTHGVYLSYPRRVTIQGLAVTGFSATHELNYRERTGGGVWGIFLANGRECVVRDCHAWLNAWGIGLNSEEYGSGDNVIERCVAWANTSRYWSHDMGGLTLFAARRDTIRDSTAFRNGIYGINIYGTGIGAEDGSGRGDYGDRDVVGNDAANRSRLVNNLAWGNECDFKIKTGVEYFHEADRCVGPGQWSVTPRNILHGLVGHGGQHPLPHTIVLAAEAALDPEREFADPANRDYRLQATSRFRGASPDGGDRGPYPYRANVFYVAPAGDDVADGLSMSNAWRTLGRGMKGLKPGDTLYLAAGVYGGDIDLTLAGAAGAPVSIRGRGREPVAIQGGLRLKDGRHVEFQRLDFAGPVTLVATAPGARSTTLFENCRFAGAPVSLEATGVAGLTVRHCAFAGFTRAALETRDGAELMLSGNLYDNRDGPAVRVDRLEALRYSDYNGYRNLARAWEVGGRVMAAAPVAGRDGHSRETGAESGTKTGVGGPLGRPAGPYRDEAPSTTLRLVEAPRVFSLSATTANLEWMTSLPATCELAWGETPDCTNALSFDVDCHGTFSLTGLAPGRPVYFRIKSIRPPTGVPSLAAAAPVTIAASPLAFVTLPEDAAPATYVVAPDGNDAGTGLDRKQAWRTLQHAANRVKPGDTVRIAGGRYTERVRIRATGDAGRPITFTCLPGEKVVMDGAEKALNTAFKVAGKEQLRFDGLYFLDFNMDPNYGWEQTWSGEFHLYRCADIAITRCFSDGRNGYTASSISAFQVRNLRIANCVNINKMGGGMYFWRCPDMRVEHTVFFAPMIASFVHRNARDQRADMDNNIFTDMLLKKAALNIGLLCVDGYIDSFRMRNNCYFLRDCIPVERRALNGETPIGKLGAYITDPLFADPRFAGDPVVAGLSTNTAGFPPDRMMNPSVKLDFDSFFATHPELVKRGIGLQRDAFKDFVFSR